MLQLIKDDYNLISSKAIYLPDTYTDEGLRLAGFSKEDIEKINYSEN